MLYTCVFVPSLILLTHTHIEIHLRIKSRKPFSKFLKPHFSLTCGKCMLLSKIEVHKSSKLIWGVQISQFDLSYMSFIYFMNPLLEYFKNLRKAYIKNMFPCNFGFFLHNKTNDPCKTNEFSSISTTNDRMNHMSPNVFLKILLGLYVVQFWISFDRHIQIHLNN